MTNKEEIKRCLTTLFPLSEPNEHIVEEIEGIICIDGFCHLPIKVSFHFDRATPIAIVDEQSNEFGKIYFSERTQSVEVHSLNEIAYASFLIENDNHLLFQTLHTLSIT